MGVLENCVYLSFAEPLCSQTLPKCPRTESSSVLKRPSDSNSALFSVTPRDRLVYASGTVRSTASNNAPYIDRVRQKERERERHAHTHPDTQRHGRTCTGILTKLKETRNSEGNAHISSHFPVATQELLHTLTLFESCNKVHKGVFVLFWFAHSKRALGVLIDPSVCFSQKKMAVFRLP